MFPLFLRATDWRRIAETLALEESLADCIFNAATTEWLDEAPLDAIVFTVIIMGIEEQADAKWDFWIIVTQTSWSSEFQDF